MSLISQTRHRARGFSLIELMVASTVALLAVSAAMVAFNAQNQALQMMDMSRTANAGSRDAMLQIETALRKAGWGVDPRFAFDFSTDCLAAYPGCRDRTDGPDQLAFLARNPMYRWVENGVAGCAVATGCFQAGKAASASAIILGTKSITVTFPENITLNRQQLVLATCLNAQNQTLLTVDTATSFVAGTAKSITFAGPASVPYNDTASLQACHGQPGAALFLVDRYRFRVHRFGTSTTPWLVLDPMMDSNGDNTVDERDYIPLAKNVEDMQVAYVLNPAPSTLSFTAPDSGGDWILGNRNATQEEPNRLAAAPTYTTSAVHADRFNAHPANLRAVRVTLVLRSDRIDSSRGPSWTGDSVTGSENLAPTILSGGRLRRYVSKTEVTLRNMASRSPFIF